MCIHICMYYIHIYTYISIYVFLYMCAVDAFLDLHIGSHLISRMKVILRKRDIEILFSKEKYQTVSRYVELYP